MRQRNTRVVLTGIVLLVLVLGFFVVMLSMAPKSNDPAGLMQTVGTVCGVVGAIALVMIVVGLVGKKSLGSDPKTLSS